MRTVLYEAHLRCGGRVIDFHGWELPVWYEGIKAEHLATREACGIFDTSHMGEIFVYGADGLALLESLVTIKVGELKKGRGRYSFLLNETGGIIDDLIIYCLEPNERYLVCVNAGNSQKDYDWIQQHNACGARVENHSDALAMLAVQGPTSEAVLKAALGFELESLKRFGAVEIATPAFGQLIIARTGYTGEAGVEIFLANAKAEPLWDALVAAGAKPCGLGARDTLRLEMGYPLHGSDIDETTSPLEAGLDFAVDLDKPGFIGLETLKRQRAEGLKRRLRGLELIDRGVPRDGQECYVGEKLVGRITSGTAIPGSNRGIALAYIEGDYNEVEIAVRDKRLKATVKQPPFKS
ncbi:MAG: Aminomethyltransferase [Deltaproteobacteria bacterium ADurb.Bin510]|nr:MAG: Aminomethyltransferase [Deltaproteobacteria bacterium ADurb.Bin510]